jgi:hypothetical protein
MFPITCIYAFSMLPKAYRSQPTIMHPPPKALFRHTRNGLFPKSLADEAKQEKPIVLPHP